jgi:hypothetical protein
MTARWETVSVGGRLDQGWGRSNAVMMKVMEADDADGVALRLVRRQRISGSSLLPLVC